MNLYSSEFESSIFLALSLKEELNQFDLNLVNNFENTAFHDLLYFKHFPEKSPPKKISISNNYEMPEALVFLINLSKKFEDINSKDNDLNIKHESNKLGYFMHILESTSIEPFSDLYWTRFIHSSLKKNFIRVCTELNLKKYQPLNFVDDLPMDLINPNSQADKISVLRNLPQTQYEPSFREVKKSDLSKLENSEQGLIALISLEHHNGNFLKRQHYFKQLIKVNVSFGEFEHIFNITKNKHELDGMLGCLAEFIISKKNNTETERWLALVANAQYEEAALITNIKFFENLQIPRPMISRFITGCAGLEQPLQTNHPIFLNPIERFKGSWKHILHIALIDYMAGRYDKADASWNYLINFDQRIASYRYADELIESPNIPYRTKDDSSLIPARIALEKLRSKTSIDFIENPAILLEVAKLLHLSKDRYNHKSYTFINKAISKLPQSRNLQANLVKFYIEDEKVDLVKPALQRLFNLPPEPFYDDSYQYEYEDAKKSYAKMLIDDANFIGAIEFLKNYYPDEKLIIECFIKQNQLVSALGELKSSQLDYKIKQHIITEILSKLLIEQNLYKIQSCAQLLCRPSIIDNLFYLYEDSTYKYDVKNIDLLIQIILFLRKHGKNEIALSLSDKIYLSSNKDISSDVVCIIAMLCWENERKNYMQNIIQDLGETLAETTSSENYMAAEKKFIQHINDISTKITKNNPDIKEVLGAVKKEILKRSNNDF